MSTLYREINRRSPAEVIADWWNELTRNPACPSDLAACSDDDVDRMARDVGMSAYELQRLVTRGPHAADFLFRRMAALDLTARKWRG